MKPVTLLMMEALNERMNLDAEEKRYLGNLLKGFNGEFAFSERLGDLKCEHILLKDLIFDPKYSGQIQLDALMFIKDCVIIYEVKNYSGDWIHGSECYRNGDIEIPNPLIQATRTKNNFKRLLSELGFDGIFVEACVVFVNPEFTLYQAEADKNVIFASQINAHIARLEQYARPYSFEFNRLSAALRAATRPDKVFHKQIPAYRFETLQKGIRCSACGCLAQRISQRRYHCNSCGFIGLNNEAVIRALQEFQLLFPEKRLNGRLLSEWCDGVLSHSQCKKIMKERLTQNFE